MRRILMRDVLTHWHGRRLSEISKADVRQLIDGIVRRGAPVAANRTLAAVKTMFAFAIEQDIFDGLAMRRIEAAGGRGRARSRVLADHEIGAVWRACQGLDTATDWQGAPLRRPYGDVIKLLILTGQRLNEVAQMSWSEVDLDAKVWSLPRERCKNGTAHQVPLSDQAIAILTSLKIEEVYESDLVFGVSGFSRAKKALDAAAKLSTPFVLHDLRRTAASGMARHGVEPHVVEAVLNHRSGTVRGVAAVYNRYSYSTEKRKDLALWGAHVTRCAGNIIIARPVAPPTAPELPAPLPEAQTRELCEA